MTEEQVAVSTAAAPAVRPLQPTDGAAPKTPWGQRLSSWAGSLFATLLAFGAVGLVVAFGLRFGWSAPKFSSLTGHAAPEKDDWCAEHSVAESECVECQKKGAVVKAHGWCRTHGVHECPLCHPDVAHSSTRPTVTDDDRERAKQALAFAPRVENNSKCKLHERRIQFTSAEAAERLGITVAPVTQAPVAEAVTANGEIGFDPTRVARLSSRLPGTLWRAYKQVGDKVRRGEMVALVDAADMGKAKAEFQQALVNLELKTQNLAGLTASTGAIPERSIQEAQTAQAEAQVRLLAARQALVNLGLPARTEDYKGVAPAAVAQQMQFLGLPGELARQVAEQTSSSNLLAVVSPFDGEVVERAGVAGESVDPTRVLYVVADTSRMWLTLHARLEDAARIRPGLPVRFSHDGHDSGDAGTVAWISPAVDEKSRTVPVRVEMPNPDGRHHARTFGTAQVVLRQEPKAVVVPSAAVHWEGDCHVVFVRDKDFDKDDAPKVFHVRSVRPGAKDVNKDGSVTEIIAGVLPGELVAATNSGILRSELLKNNLGAG